MSQRQIAAFDFDGTITKRDTLFPFLKKYGLLNLLLPLISSTETRVQFALIELPDMTGPGKRNLLMP